jgi:putative FmdB family regulatory protein
MPIYAYRCSACGHSKDVLQKMSDPVLHTCPACGAEAFTKQVTAAGFQLKGSGWYATDFKGSGAAPAAPAKAGGGDGDSKSAGTDASAATPAADKSAPTAPAPAASDTSSAGKSSGTAAAPSP